MTKFYKIGEANFQNEKNQKRGNHLMVSFFLLFSLFGLQAQTTIINPATDGGFNSGNTFAANGWTVANQGVSPVKWAVGTAASGTTATGATTSTSAAVTLTAANPNISVGQIVYGAGIPANTFVSAISGTTLTLSQTATLTGSGVTLGFGMFSGGISVGAVQTTNTSIAIGTYTVTLSAANPNISVGMAIAPVAGFIAPNTFVASISGTALGLSQASINPAALATAQTLVFSATSSAISGNAAYISNDNGTTNSYGGHPTARTVYFYRDVTVPAAEKAMTLTFDVKSAPASGGGWQVWVAPTSQTVTGTDTQITTPFIYNPTWLGANATLISFNSNPQVATTKTTAFIPKSFAGTPFRLIFVWTNSTSAGTLPPAAIDNISLTSRLPEEITCAKSGLWSQPGTWDGGNVPTPADGVVLDNNAEVVMVDCRYSGCEDLILAGTNTLLQFSVSTVVDEFTVNNDVNIAASGARLNNHDGTNGKYLKVGHDFTVGANARFDSQLGFSGFNSRLNLNGSTLQTFTVDPAGFMGGSAPGVNTSSNVSNVLGTLEVTNTSTASPNVIWDADGVRIKSGLLLTSGRLKIASGKRLILGNFSGLTNITCPTGFGIIEGTLSKWMQATSSTVISNGTEYPNTDNNFKSFWYPFVNGTNLNRSLYLLANANPTISGEIAITYADATSLTAGLSIVDGGYTINNRYGANWTFSTPNSSVTGTALTLTNPTGTYRLAVHAPGAYAALDGTSRLMNLNTALPGTHQDGTALPFMVRNGLTIADLTALPIYIGVSDGSKITSANTITSTLTGGDRDWNTPASWVGGVVPTCTNNVIIASGSTVNITTTADAASVVINAGGIMTNNGSATTMTVGCTNNNAAFINFGTHTMNSGTLKVNGFMAHKFNSTFNQSGGEIIIDSNNNGDAATSVAFGGSSCKIDTSNLALTGGKITIVDPLVNISTPVSVTSLADFNIATEGVTGTFNRTTNAAATSGTTTLTFAISNGANIITAGQSVTGTGIAANTTVVSSTPNGFGTVTTVILSSPINANIASGGTITFSSMSNGCSGIVFAANATNTSISVGQGVSGPGIQAGTTITNVAFTGFDAATSIGKITLSLPVSGLGTSPITGVQTLTIAAVTPGASLTTLPAANPNLVIGMPVSGNGLLPGTFISDISGANVTFSNPIQVGAPSPLVFNAYPFNTQSSGSFIYASPNHYATGINHTLQIGDGISNQNTAVITTGFNCQFQALGGLLSIGNLIVDAPNGAERFMNASSNNVNAGTVPSGYNINIQNTLTITAGSVFKKTFANAPVYIGGNIINNGSLLMPRGQQLYLGNIINGVLTPTALPQTISGSGTFLANEWSLTGNSTFPGFSVGNLTVNNTSSAGVTIGVPNFRVSGVSLTSGIVHTTLTNTIYCGAPDIMNPIYNSGTFGFSTGAVGSNTCHIDGPIVHSNKYDANINQNRLFPVGKNGKYLPISVASTGGAEIMAEAFDTNSGTTSANASNLSSNRWKVSRVGAIGGFTGYSVRLGSFNNPVTASNLIVHAPTENGVYDILSTPASVMTYDLSHFSLTNLPTIALTTPQTGGFLGNFSYADGPACTGTPAPGATIASPTTVCVGQPITLSLTTPTTGVGVTYQWQSSTNAGTSWSNIDNATNATLVASPSVATSYQCVVTCSSVSGTSTPVAVAVSQSSATASNVTICEPGTASLTATGSSTFNWYDAAINGNLLTSGASYSPTVAATTSYYVASVNTTASTANTAIWNGTGSTTSTALFKGIAFDVSNKIKLKTVTVYPKNTTALTPITVSLFDASGTVVAGTAPVTFIPTLVTGTIGTTPQVVTLNYTIPAGTSYRLVVTNGLITTTNTLGNSAGVITYPTTGTLKLLGNVSALNDAISTTANITNCFHNLAYDEICESVTRTPVTVTLGSTPATPTVTTTAATCTIAGSTTITNYNASLTYTFAPTGPTVSTGGLVTGATAGTAYTVTAGNSDCTSATASFTNAAILATPATPTVITTAATCTIAGSTTITNYNASLTYTFAPTGPTVSTGGLVTGATAGTAYTVTAGNSDCTSATASFTNAVILATPATPTVTTTAATCTIAGSTTITNYNAILTYTFAPTGPTVSTGGLVTGATAGTAYTVTAGNSDCTSATASFTNAAILATPATPTVTTTAATCTIAGSTTITNYNASLTYTFAPTGPTVSTGGLVTGATAGTAYTVTAGNSDCTSVTASFTNSVILATPATPTVTTTAAACTIAGSTTITNYNASLTYTFAPTGPTVSTGGIVTGATAGTAYTVTAGNSNCTSATASFTNAAILATPATPTVTTTAATCTIAGSTTITNYNASLTYTFAPTGPTVSTGGLVTGATAGTAYTVTAGNSDCTSATASFTNAAILATPATPTVTTTAAACTIAGSTTITNYNASLTYTFAPTGPTVSTGGLVTGATAGTAYTVTAGNSNCTSATASFTNAAILATPATPTVTTTAATCTIAGSTTITNYNASLTYTFAPTGPTVSTGGLVTGATAGTAYTVTAGNSNCTSATASFTNAAILATPATPTVTTTAATCTIAGSTTITNYNASLTYTFAPTGPTVSTGGLVTGATAGTAYTVTAGNSNCTSSTASFTNAAILATPATPTVSTTAATCTTAGSTTITNYNASLTYTFAPTGPTVSTGGLVTGATAGTAYTVTAGNSNCTSATASFTNAAILPAPTAPTGSTSQNLVGGVAADVTIEDIVVTGSNGNWYATSTNALDNINPLPAGTILVSGNTYYTVSVSSNGCISSTALAVTVSITLATESFEIENLTFYPNPVENQLTITANDVITKIEIFNLIGQQIKTISNNSNAIQADLSELSSTTYFIKVYSEQKNQTIKIIKK